MLRDFRLGDIALQHLTLPGNLHEFVYDEGVKYGKGQDRANSQNDFTDDEIDFKHDIFRHKKIFFRLPDAGRAANGGVTAAKVAPTVLHLVDVALATFFNVDPTTERSVPAPGIVADLCDRVEVVDKRAGRDDPILKAEGHMD